MQRIKIKFWLSAVIMLFTAAFAVVGISYAATTIGNNISTGGTVGVSTSSPAQTLGVQGNSYVSGTALFGGALTATSTIVVQSTTATSTVSTGGLTVGSSQLVVQQTSGRVGIGSSTPMYAFAIQNTATPQVALAYNAENYFTISTGANGTTTLAVVGGQYASLLANTPLRIATTSAFALEVRDTSDNNILVVDTSSRRVGVSSSTPALAFAVQGDSYFAGTALFSGVLTATSSIAVQSTTATSTISTGGFTVGSTHLVVQQTSGRVGIGSSTPTDLFVVNAPAGLDAFEVGSSTGSVLKVDKNQRVGVGSSTPSAVFSVNAPAAQDAFAVGSSTNPIFLITENMRVGIGTTTPLARFSVDAGGTATTTIDLGKVCFRSITSGGTTIFWYLKNADAASGMQIATTTDTACGF